MQLTASDSDSDTGFLFLGSDWEAVEDSVAIMATKKIMQQQRERHNSSSSRRQIKVKEVTVTTEVPHLSGGLDFRMNFT